MAVQPFFGRFCLTVKVDGLVMAPLHHKDIVVRAALCGALAFSALAMSGCNEDMMEKMTMVEAQEFKPAQIQASQQPEAVQQQETAQQGHAEGAQEAEPSQEQEAKEPTPDERRTALIQERDAARNKDDVLFSHACVRAASVSVGINEGSSVTFIPSCDRTVSVIGQDAPKPQVRENDTSLNIVVPAGVHYTITLPDNAINDLLVYNDTNRHAVPTEKPAKGTSLVMDDVRLCGNIDIYGVSSLSIRNYVHAGEITGKMIIKECGEVNLYNVKTGYLDAEGDCDYMTANQITAFTKLINIKHGGRLYVRNVMGSNNTFGVNYGVIVYDSIRNVKDELFLINGPDHRRLYDAVAPNLADYKGKGKIKTTLEINGYGKVKVTFAHGVVREHEYWVPTYGRRAPYIPIE